MSDAPFVHRPLEPNRICGPAPVRALFLRRPEQVLRLFYTEDRRRLVGPLCSYLSRSRRPYREVPPDELARIAGTQHHGGVCAVAAGRLGEIELHCLYVPAGGDVPDPALNDKFAHKLRFLDEMIAWWPAAGKAGRPMVLVGDLNIAPLEHDVWSHSQLLDVVSHTPVEVEKLAALQGTLGWIDAARVFVPPEKKLYSWWSYRAKDWRASGRGRRLDHIWITPALEGALKACTILGGVRGWEPKPSDHAPVIAELMP